MVKSKSWWYWCLDTTGVLRSHSAGMLVQVGFEHARIMLTVADMCYPKCFYPTTKHLPVRRVEIDVFKDLRR